MVGGGRRGGGRGVRGRTRVLHATAAQVLWHAQQVVARVAMVLGKEAQKVVMLVSTSLAGRRGHQVVEVGRGRRTHPLAPVQAKAVHVWQLKS